MLPRLAQRGAPALSLLLSLVALLFTLGCDTAKQRSTPLRLGLSDWAGHAPFYGAAKLDLFGGTRVEIKSFSSNFDRNRAFAQGRLDVLATPLFDAIRIADEGVPLKVVLLFDYSSGGDGIVARGDVASVRDLKGKRVSAELDAITHFVLLAALGEAGLTESDVQLVNLSVPEAADAFARGALDAATLWDPHLARQAASTGAHKIFTSKEIPGRIIDVLIVQKAVAEKRPEDVTNLVRGWERTLEAWKARPEEVGATMAQETNRTPAGLSADFAGMELLDLAENAALYRLSAEGPSVWRSFDATVQFMVQHKLLKRAAPLGGDVLDARFVGLAQAR